VESLNRYIGALEGRISYLDKVAKKQRKTIKELRRVVGSLENIILAGRVADDPPIP
jgi:hypothetical protein